MTTSDWYRRTVRDDTVNAVAVRSGVVQSTLARQVKAGALSAETVLSIARAYSADVIEALVACGFVTRDEVRRHGIQAALRDALDIELAAEVTRRLGGGPLDQPLR